MKSRLRRLEVSIHGRPGSGKSVLAAKLVQFLESEGYSVEMYEGEASLIPMPPHRFDQDVRVEEGSLVRVGTIQWSGWGLSSDNLTTRGGL